MFFTNIISYYILFISITIFYIVSILNKNCKTRENYFHYICDSYNPVRNLIGDKEICKLYDVKFLSKALDTNLTVEEVQQYFESLVAEYIINLINQSINVTDPFIKIKFETKLYKILNIYIKCYQPNQIENSILIDNYKFLLIAKIIDILSEVNIDIFYISKELRKLLNQNSYDLSFFDSYSEHRKKMILNTDNLILDLEEVENLYTILKSKT